MPLNDSRSSALAMSTSFALPSMVAVVCDPEGMPRAAKEGNKDQARMSYKAETTSKAGPHAPLMDAHRQLFPSDDHILCPSCKVSRTSLLSMVEGGNGSRAHPSAREAKQSCRLSVSYTHLTLPTILLV